MRTFVLIALLGATLHVLAQPHPSLRTDLATCPWGVGLASSGSGRPNGTVHPSMERFVAALSLDLIPAKLRTQLAEIIYTNMMGRMGSDTISASDPPLGLARTRLLANETKHRRVDNSMVLVDLFFAHEPGWNAYVAFHGPAAILDVCGRKMRTSRHSKRFLLLPEEVGERFISRFVGRYIWRTIPPKP